MAGNKAGPPPGPRPIVNDSSWAEAAACSGIGAGLFFVSSTNAEADIEKFEEARSYCDACPVKKQCVEEGIRYRDHLVIRGGRILHWSRSGRLTMIDPTRGEEAAA